LPLLIRPGAAIPYNSSLTTPEGDYLDGLEVLVNGPLEGEGQAEVVLPSNVHEVHTSIKMSEAKKTKDLAAGVTDLV
jgi:hypothetical protein